MNEPIRMPIPGTVDISTLFEAEMQQPMVQLELPRRAVRLSPEDAITVGLRMLEAAKAASVDAFLIDWMRNSAFEEEQVLQLLDQFRLWREARIARAVES
jgi:hypothetical protein